MGWNLYGFVRNNSIIDFDLLGKITYQECTKEVQYLLNNPSGYLKASIKAIKSNKKCAFPSTICMCNLNKKSTF